MALSTNARLARLIGHLDPRAWDWLIPHGPFVHVHHHAFGPRPEHAPAFARRAPQRQ